MLLILNIASGQPVLTKKAYKVTRITEAPLINGTINDDEWAPGEWNGDFIQYEPHDGKPAT